MWLLMNMLSYWLMLHVLSLCLYGWLKLSWINKNAEVINSFDIVC